MSSLSQPSELIDFDLTSSPQHSDSSLSPSPKSSELMTPVDGQSCDDAFGSQHQSQDDRKSDDPPKKKSIFLSPTCPRSSPSVRVSFIPFGSGAKSPHRLHSGGGAIIEHCVDDGIDGGTPDYTMQEEEDLSSVMENDGDEESEGISAAIPKQKRKASRVGKWNVEARERNGKQAKPRGRRRSYSPSSDNPAPADGLHELESPVDAASLAAFGPPSSWTKSGRGPYQSSITSTGSSPSPASSILSFRNLVNGVGHRKGSWSSWSSSGSKTEGERGSLLRDKDLNVFSDIPYTHKVLESATVRRLGSVSEREVFVCQGGVEPGTLLQIVRRDVMKACTAKGGDRLIEEIWSYTVKPKKGTYKVTVSYSAMSAKDTSSDAPSDPQKPVCLNLAISIPGLMTIKERS